MQNNFYLIYQMGKVGSSSIRFSLEKKYGTANVVHTHSHEIALKTLNDVKKDYDKVVVVTGFREPLTRGISAYFQNIDDPKSSWYLGNSEYVSQAEISSVINHFDENIKTNLNIVNYWLHEFEKVCGFKIPNYNSSDFMIKVCLGNVHHYFYKLERFDNFCKYLTEDELFADVLPFGISNDSKHKWYGPIYKNFLSTYTIKQNLYDRLYGNVDYVNRFYTKKEITDIVDKYFDRP